MDISKITMTVNGIKHSFVVGNDGSEGVIPFNEKLSTTIRERLHLTGTKEACSEGACGCCTVIMDGKAVPSCIQLTAECDGADIVTIEGLQDPVTGALDPLQQAFIDKYAFQCGYCTPGIIMSTKALLLKNPTPDRHEIEEALAGNYCRCISHYHVFEAIAQVIAEAGGEK